MQNPLVKIGRFIKLPLYFLLLSIVSFVLIIISAFYTTVPFFQLRYRAIAPYNIDVQEMFCANLNTIDIKGLCAIPGIGEKRAKAIISYREKIGLFESIEELENVDGISTKSIENWREYLYVE